jgi:transcriptional regulator with XRE-family HTH domain
MQLKDVFVQNLRKCRKEKGISQMALAERCGTSTSYIGQIEIGNRVPSLEMIEKIAGALQIRPHVLLFIGPDEDKAEQAPQTRTSGMSDTMKNELIKRLSKAVQRVVKQIN